MASILAAALICLFAVSARAEDEYVRTRSGNIEVVHDERIADGAIEAMRLYRQSMAEIAAKLSIEDFSEAPATIVLVKSKDGFVRLSGSEQIAAYAVGARDLIVIDYHRVIARPFTMAGTMMHEAAHIAIHKHVGRDVPRWFNEGVAQWVSGAEAELELSPMGSALDKAALTDRLVPLSRLETAFPSDMLGMQLAYEQSASVVEYIVAKHGERSIGRILSGLRDGMNMDEAMRSALGAGYKELESAWAGSLKTKASWLHYILGNFMEVLLIAAALLSVVGFIIMQNRIRNYRDEDEEDIRAMDTVNQEDRPDNDEEF